MKSGRALPPIAAPFEPADFCVEEMPAMDAPMWPVHPFTWLQPDLQPVLPDMCGLAIERHHKLPAPGLVDLGMQVIHGPGANEAAREEVRRRRGVPREIAPVPHYAVPASNLPLLGWDPRAERRIGKA